MGSRTRGAGNAKLGSVNSSSVEAQSYFKETKMRAHTKKEGGEGKSRGRFHSHRMGMSRASRFYLIIDLLKSVN